MRGYGAKHQALRRGIAEQVEAGLVRCARCGELIAAGYAASGTARALASAKLRRASIVRSV
jgi:hypothetical protein